MLKQSSKAGMVLAIALLSHTALGATEFTPYVGNRFTSNIALHTAGASTTNELRFTDSAAAGILINTDLAGQSSQYQLYYSHQRTQARPSTPADFGGLVQFDVAIDRLQIGGLYFPGGGARGGFVEGTLGVTRLAPRAAGLETEYYPSIALGGGAKFPLSAHLLLRADLRGIYTALRTDASIFCAGGCTARTASRGYFQVEAAVGLAFRF